MDFIAHGLIGVAVAVPLAKTPEEAAWIVGFSFLPDILQIPLYLFVGHKEKRRFWIPHRIDWSGIRRKFPVWSRLWEIPHSLLFVLFIILPVIIIFNISWLALLAYVIHIIFDIFTHTKEWAVKLFYPFNFKIVGFTDAWAWEYKHWLLTWIVLGFIILYLRFIF